MTLRIRHLLIDVSTANGRYGRTLAFGDGLNVIRADNSMGKSTILQSIIYGLGLEGMFGPSQDVPLAHAVTEYLEDGDKIINVLEAAVYLEIENSDGAHLTIQRSIKGTRNRHLVTVTGGRALTGGATGPAQDYFVRERSRQSAKEDFTRSWPNSWGGTCQTCRVMTTRTARCIWR